MRPVQVTVGALAGASANSIAMSQTPGAAGNLTLNGALVINGVAVIAAPSQITLTFADNETGHSFVVTGYDQNNSLVTETIAGTTAGTVTSVLTYSRVTQIAISAAATGAITAGNAQSGASPWVRMDEWALPSIGVFCTVTGTVNYTVQQTQDDPNSPTNPVTADTVTWIQCPDLNLVAQTATAQAQYTYVPCWIRTVLNSGGGSVTTTITQAGNVPR